jgi:hypothetical protein
MLSTFPRPSDNPHADPISPHCCRQGSYYAGWALRTLAPARWEQVSRAGVGRRGAELAASARTTQRPRGKASTVGWSRSIRRMPCNSEGRAPWHAGPEHVHTRQRNRTWQPPLLAVAWGRINARGVRAQIGGTQMSAPRADKNRSRTPDSLHTSQHQARVPLRRHVRVCNSLVVKYLQNNVYCCSWTRLRVISVSSCLWPSATKGGGECQVPRLSVGRHVIRPLCMLHLSSRRRPAHRAPAVTRACARAVASVATLVPRPTARVLSSRLCPCLRLDTTGP